MRKAPTHLALASATAALVAATQLGASCGQTALTILPGVTNNPNNLSLRRELLSYGTRTFCDEMLGRSVPMKLRDEDPAVGRFYPSSCLAQELANKNLFVQFSGTGFVWTNVTKKVAFQAGGELEYETDFRVADGDMYIYFRQKNQTKTSFQVTLVEQQLPAQLGGLLLGQKPDAQAMAQAFGQKLLQTELARGFTVIRESDGSAAFGLGVVEVGEKPRAPYALGDNGRITLANERTEIHQNQRDYTGPFEVKSKGQALHLAAFVEGAPSVDVMIVRKETGDGWIRAYTTQVAPPPPPVQPAFDETVNAGTQWRRVVALPRGRYYVVFDNTATAGRSAPPAVLGDDRAPLVTYAVELGDAP